MEPKLSYSKFANNSDLINWEHSEDAKYHLMPLNWKSSLEVSKSIYLARSTLQSVDYESSSINIESNIKLSSSSSSSVIRFKFLITKSIYPLELSIIVISEF